jgi:iron complex transport system substrate-binding protein
MRWCLWIGITFAFTTGCIRSGTPATGQDHMHGKHYTKYAERFDVTDLGGCRLLEVRDPWQNSRNITFGYVLGDSLELVPDSLADYPFIKIPVSRVITMSTTHVAMISQLGMASSIVGASGTGYIYDQEIRKRIENGMVREVGHDQGLNYETIVSLEPDVLFLFGVEGSVTAASQKLEEMGIQVVYCAEYLENHPLGKAEWIRFFAQFFGMEEEASHFFDRIDSSYQELAYLASESGEEPLVLTGLPWKDTWYMAGGQSFASRLIEDAGGNFLWKENPSSEAVPMDIESVYARAFTAGIWINPGVAGSIGELIRSDERFSDLPVVRTGRVYNNIARMNSGGGNDYWESGTVRPDLILADLIFLFHPSILPDHALIYYRKLK